MERTDTPGRCSGRKRWLARISSLAAISGVVWAQVVPPAKLPGAKQIGLSCAFYANVPALTKVSGIQIVDVTPASRALVASIYGLRRGDFEFRSAFDKEVFFELFGMPSKGARHDYADIPRKRLFIEAESLISDVFEPALDRGDFISLRAIGPFGGPHNVLLVGHGNGKYRYHDPTMGKIYTAERRVLAARILSESKQDSPQAKKRYFSSYRFVSVGGASRFTGHPLHVGQLSDAIELRLTEAQQTGLLAKLAAAEAFDPSQVEQVVKAFPGVDFAVISRRNQGTTVLVSAVSRELPAKDLRGVANLAKLAINSYQIGARDLLPVWMIDGRPCVVTGYAKAGTSGETTTVTWLDRDGTKTVDLTTALAKLKAAGPLIGYVGVTRK